MRKQIEPSASGAQTSRLYWFASSPRRSASKVLMLKKIVPATWTAEAHQSSPRQASAVVSSCRVAAEVKKIEPTKNTSPSTREPTSSTKPGNGPTRKHVEPIAKRTPTHHDACRGRHQWTRMRRSAGAAASTPIGSDRTTSPDQD